MSQPEQPPAVVPAFLEADRDTLRDQLSAAWQLQLEQVTQLLEQGWCDHLAHAVDERFAGIAAGVETEIARRVADATEAVESTAREAAAAEIRRSTERLNQTARRLEQSEDAEAWGAALLDGLHAFAPHVALFSVLTGRLRYEGHRASAGRDLDRLASIDVPLNEAPAFVNVTESLDTVIALATPGELSEPLAQALQTDPSRRVCLLPVLIGRAGAKRRAAAVVYAESDAAPADTNALEVLVSLAGAMLDCRLNRRAPAVRAEAPAAASAELVTIGPPPAGDEAGEPVPEAAPQPPAPPPVATLPREEQEWHARAQRFARVRVAEMRLYQAQAVRHGREHARLYMALRGEMDRSRAQFKHEFLHVPSMIDYFHLEVVRTLANDDPVLLGQEYPGPLV